MKPRHLALIAGSSYVVIFFTAIFANFVVLEALKTDPLTTVQEHGFMVRLGIMAFLVAAVFDIIVAWALFDLFKNHPLSQPSTYFRLTHAVIMGLAVFSLQSIFLLGKDGFDYAIVERVQLFNMMWLIGLFFFGVHLIFLSRIVKFIKIIPYFLFAAGVMYMVDTSAHFLMANYDDYAGIFLSLVAIPSIAGEMAFGIWLLVRGGKEEVAPELA